MSLPAQSRTVMSRALIPCVCSGSSGWCCVSLSGCVWVQRETEGEREVTRVKTIWLGTGPAQPPRALLSPSSQITPLSAQGRNNRIIWRLPYPLLDPLGSLPPASEQMSKVGQLPGPIQSHAGSGPRLGVPCMGAGQGALHRQGRFWHRHARQC